MSTPIPSLSALVGAHPDALREIYADGRPADPVDLGEAPRGRVLALGTGAQLFLLGRPLVRAFSTELFPWKGMRFNPHGASGENVLLGLGVLRFRTEVGPSRLDGRPALILTYAAPAHGNPWPFRAFTDELRLVGGSVAVGPTFFEASTKPLLWFGLGIV